MSRLGKKPILIPDKIVVEFKDNIFSVKGPLGENSRYFKDDINIIIDEKEKNITLSPKNELEGNKALWGTYTSHINNMIKGVSDGFEKKLILEGVGFKVQIEGNNLVLGLGFSHPVKIEIIEGIKVQVEKNTIIISGIDKEKVGSFSAKVRALKKPEPYKGKGIRYDNEVVRRKAGKKAATTAA